MAKNINWYSLDKILKYEAQYYIIFGERSNGKSYAVDKYVIDKYFEDGSQFGLVKRFEEDIKMKYMRELISQELQDYILEKYNKKIRFYCGQWLLYDKDSEGKMSECEVFGTAFSLAGVNRTKATTYNKINTIIFEEFMSMNCEYLNDEVNMFLNLVSTITRHRHYVKIFMLANAISKFSPYSSALGIKLHRMKKGEIVLKKYSDDKGFNTNFAIERTGNVNVFDNNENENKIVYNIFGNSGVGKMITSGDFETHKYKRSISNVAFSELKKKGNIVVGKKHRLPIYLRFEDYYYNIYLINNGKNILAFRETERCNFDNKYVINGLDGDGININNLACYNDENINRILNIIVVCMRQKDFITLTDDDGENVVNGFRLSGITLLN